MPQHRAPGPRHRDRRGPTPRSRHIQRWARLGPTHSPDTESAGTGLDTESPDTESAGAQHLALDTCGAGPRHREHRGPTQRAPGPDTESTEPDAESIWAGHRQRESADTESGGKALGPTQIPRAREHALCVQAQEARAHAGYFRLGLQRLCRALFCSGVRLNHCNVFVSTTYLGRARYRARYGRQRNLASRMLAAQRSMCWGRRFVAVCRDLCRAPGALPPLSVSGPGALCFGSPLSVSGPGALSLGARRSLCRAAAVFCAGAGHRLKQKLQNKITIQPSHPRSNTCRLKYSSTY